jgi:hypothetical protein
MRSDKGQTILMELFQTEKAIHADPFSPPETRLDGSHNRLKGILW